ncbi:unnamed protein product [Cochlearia groenlandica]
MRLTKGKQKIEMKEVEMYADRMITFSKRKAGIFKKMNEIMSMCDVKGAFFVFSHAGKPYSLAKPSMEKMVKMFEIRSSEDEPISEKNDTEPIVEAYKKQMIEDLMIRYLESDDQLDMEKEKLNMLKKTKYEKELKKMWWNIPSKGVLSGEESDQKHKTFCELYDDLCDLAFQKHDHGSSSSGRGRPFGYGET